MRRINLMEFEDEAWCPRVVRDYATDYLGFIEHQFGLYESTLPILEQFLRDTETRAMVDLCSGSGGPLPRFVPELRRRGLVLKVTLTDLFPNSRTFEQNAASALEEIDYSAVPVDATKVPPELTGTRVMFTAVHHFRPDQVKEILQNATASRTPVAMFDTANRTLPAMLSILWTPLGVAIATPFIGPFHLTRLLLTYLIPVIPFICLWDGLASMFRAYTEQELMEMALAVGEEQYRWVAGSAPHRRLPMKVTYLLGYPCSKATPNRVCAGRADDS